MRLHANTLYAGLVFLGLGIAFLFEASGAWDLDVEDLRFAGPLALVLVGVAVVIGALRSRDGQPGS